MFALWRLAVQNWWRRKRASYMNVSEQKDDTTANQDYRIGVSNLYEDETDLLEDIGSQPSDETRSEDSYFDVTSETSSQDDRKTDMKISTCALDDDIMNCQWAPPSQRMRRQFSTDDIILTRPFPLAPCRSFSTSSVVSIDSLITPSGLNSDNEGNSCVVTDFGIYVQEPFRFLSSSTSTTDDTQTNSDSDYFQYFFIQHMDFLRNQTRPRRIRERTLSHRGPSTNMSVLNIETRSISNNNYS